MKVGVLGPAVGWAPRRAGPWKLSDGLQLVAALDLGDDRAAAEAADVAVDFTHPDAVMDNLAWCIQRDIHAVVGTTGFTDEKFDAVRRQLAEHPSVGVVIAANFSIGAVLMMHFAEQAAKFYESAEIIDCTTQPRRTPRPVRPPRPRSAGGGCPAVRRSAAVARRDGSGATRRPRGLSRSHPGARCAASGAGRSPGGALRRGKARRLRVFGTTPLIGSPSCPA